MSRKGKNLRKKFLLVSSLFIAGCFDVTGSEVAFVNTDTQEARVYTITGKCPITVNEPTLVPMSALNGWCAIPPDQCAEFRRQYEKKECN